jgi:hypothetical protein
MNSLAVNGSIHQPPGSVRNVMGRPTLY